MSPLDVQRRLQCPNRAYRRKGGAASLVDLSEFWRIGQAERPIEIVQVADHPRIMKSLDDSDGLPAAVGLHVTIGEGELIEAIGMANLSGSEDRKQISCFELLDLQTNVPHDFSPLTVVRGSDARTGSARKSPNDPSAANGASSSSITFRFHANPSAEDVS